MAHAEDYKELVTESVVCQKQAARLMYTLQTEDPSGYTVSDIARMHGLLENVTSIMGAVLRDEDRSRIRLKG